ncbi:MAG: hypothetical protein ACLRRN_08480 [Oscillospiraceae bacterium]
MKPWMRTALAVALVLAIAAGGFFLPNLVAARLDRADQDTAFSLSTGDEQGPATVLRRKLTDGMQNLFYGAEEPVELDESAAAHTLAEMTQYAQDLLGALEKDSALFGGGFSVEEDATVQYASYGSGFVLWGIALSNPRGDTASFLLDDATGCVLALSYTFSDSYAFQIRQNDLWITCCACLKPASAPRSRPRSACRTTRCRSRCRKRRKKCSVCAQAVETPFPCSCSTPETRAVTTTAWTAASPTTCSFMTRTPTRPFPCRRGAWKILCISTHNDAVSMPKRCRTDHSLR